MSASLSPAALTGSFHGYDWAGKGFRQEKGLNVKLRLEGYKTAESQCLQALEAVLDA